MIRPASWFLGVLAVLALSDAIHAQTIKEEPRRVDGVSTEKFVEFAPTISADGNTMIIQSNRNSPRSTESWELFESVRSPGGTWSDVTPLTTINKKCSFLAGPCLSYDGNRIYFTAFINGVTTSEDIFYAERLDNTQWGEPKSVGAPINTEAFEGFPSISADGNSLYFMRVNLIDPVDKKSKENCFEIFVSTLQADGKWGQPKKLPSQINLGCVRDPRIMADNHTLIFSAIISSGKGKYDLFQSKKTADGKWTTAKPLDFINSPENDQSPTISAAGNVIYYYTKNDIYAMPIPMEFRQSTNVTAQGFVKTEQRRFPVSTNIEVYNLDTREKVNKINNPYDGRFSLVMAAGSRYRVEFYNPGFVKETREFDFKKQEVYEEISLNINLKSTYHASIAATDFDLKASLDAFVQVSNEQGALIWKDSVKAGQPLKPIALETVHQYQITVTREAYQEVKQSLVFNAQIFRADTTLTFQLTHDKIKFVAEVTDITSNKRVRTKVTFNNTTQDEVIIAESGESVYLRKGDRYQVVASSDKGYFFATTNVLAGGGEVTQDGVYRLNTAITPIKEGASLTLTNITFETNSAEIKQSSYSELDRVIELMRQNPALIIEIAAHTDDVGTAKYNLKLSQLRAESVVTYLKSNGIVNERFEARGYGKTKPLTPNQNKESRARNRRVELVVLKAG